MDRDIKQEVRQFYDRVGWQKVADGVYQNARYEDLRPVASEYIHRCHLRVNRHLRQGGRFLLDAGSGPIQYPEYLTYSQTYQKRVCLDISIVALQEARQRIGERGVYVVADVANLPFQTAVFDGIDRRQHADMRIEPAQLADFVRWWFGSEPQIHFRHIGQPFAAPLPPAPQVAGPGIGRMDVGSNASEV